MAIYNIVYWLLNIQKDNLKKFEIILLLHLLFIFTCDLVYYKPKKVIII